MMFLDVVGYTWMMFPAEVERISITRRDFYYVLPAKVLKLGMSSVNPTLRILRIWVCLKIGYPNIIIFPFFNGCLGGILIFRHTNIG